MIGQTWIFVNMMIKTQLQKKKESKLSKSHHLNGQDSFVFIFHFLWLKSNCNMDQGVHRGENQVYPITILWWLNSILRKKNGCQDVMTKFQPASWWSTFFFPNWNSMIIWTLTRVSTRIETRPSLVVIHVVT